MNGRESQGREYDNTNRGSLFVNERKQSDTSPDRNGSAEIECPHCGRVFGVWLNGWLQTIRRGANAGKQFLSLSFTPKSDSGSRQGYGGNSRRPYPSGGQNRQEPGQPPEDDIPF